MSAQTLTSAKGISGDTVADLREVASSWDDSARTCDVIGEPELAARDRRFAAAMREAANILALNVRRYYTLRTQDSDATVSSAGELPPGRLWSLWELMRKLRSDKFFKTYEQASVFHQYLATLRDHDHLISLRDADEKIELFTALAQELTSMGVSGAAAAVKRATDLMKAAPRVHRDGKDAISLVSADVYRIHAALSQATSGLPDHLTTQVVLVLDPRRLDFYEQDKLFGEEVFNNFASANEDIAEAGTCLALDRGTACVMHLMRVLEAGLSALARTLGVKPQNDWGSYLRKIDDELGNRQKSAGARTTDEQFYAEVSTHLGHMRVAWRNPTMHVEKSYSVERAQDILFSVRSFMKHLATMIKESGP